LSDPRRPLARAVAVAGAAVLPLLLALPPAVSAAAERPAPSDAVMHRQWVGQWLSCAGAPERDPGVFRFRKVLEVAEAPRHFVVNASGDNRFVLYVNGRRVGTGPARGDLYFWRFETFDLAPFLVPGRNLLTALVWSFGMEAPVAQVNLRTGFVMQGDGPDEQSANTDATWECAAEPGHAMWRDGVRAVREEARQYFVVGPGERLDAAAYNWDWATLPPVAGVPPAAASRWSPAVPYGAPSPRSIREGPGWALSPEGRLLVPNDLPPQEYRPVPAGEVVRASGATITDGFPASAPATVAAHTTATILLDRRTLVAAYPEVAFSGGRGARLRLTYQEALVDEHFDKGNRDEIEGKRMVGLSDEVLPDGSGGRTFEPLWWRTWRYLQIDVATADEPLSIDGVRAFATGYPFEEEARLATDDDTLERIWEVGWRTARLCAHETYMDCPYYEQLQYVGDTRIQALISYVVSGDDRLARQAIRAFARSRRSEGITSSRYPAREPQYIPPFSLLWVGMVHDFWQYRDDPAFVREQLPVTRTVLEWFLDHTSPTGLLGRLPWWSFLDWSPRFEAGVPPQETDGQSAPLSLQMVNALREAADLEEATGDPMRAVRYRQRAQAAADTVVKLCWDDARGLVADRPSKDRFSQQTNILAVLAGALPPGQVDRVLDKILAAGAPPPGEEEAPATSDTEREPARASYYFRFYLARALEKAGRGNAYLLQLEPWREMLDLGLSTWAERPGRTRSDCHAWSAHPNYDLLTIVAGIRPASPGFRSVRIEPHLGTLGQLDVRMPHPRGAITASYRRDDKALEVRIHLPPGLRGEFVWGDLTRTLREGDQSFRVE
jgi:alpha-L-rhamnosidase